MLRLLLTSVPDAAAGVLTLGTKTLYVGATLSVLALQLAGVYTNITGFEVIVIIIDFILIGL